MKVIIGMATMQGREQYREKAIESLMSNTVRPDKIVIYDNSTEPVDLTDNGKFFGLSLSLYTEPVYYLSTDDDLLYPKDYIQRTIEAIDAHQCIITYHGRILKGEGRHYYTGHRSFRFMDTQHRAIILDVCGTGVTGFRTDIFNPIGIHSTHHKKMSDLVFSLEAAKHKVKIMLIPHRGGWIRQQDIPHSSTILGQHLNDCSEQGQIADEIYRLRRQ